MYSLDEEGLPFDFLKFLYVFILNRKSLHKYLSNKKSMFIQNKTVFLFASWIYTEQRSYERTMDSALDVTMYKYVKATFPKLC